MVKEKKCHNRLEKAMWEYERNYIITNIWSGLKVKF